MPGAPDWTEEKHRRQMAMVGLTESLDLEKRNQTTFNGNWLPIASFACLHQNSYFSVGDSVFSTDETSRFRYQEPPLQTVEEEEIERLQFKEKQSILAANKYNSLADHAKTVEPGEPTVITYGTDETFWQALGAFEIAADDYIVFPEALSDRWTHGIPDLTCFRLGDLHEVLADIGLIPGGATLEEIELRSVSDVYEPVTIEVDESVGIAEAKKSDTAKNGVRQLTSHRGSKNKDPYLDGNAIKQGWLISPEATTAIQSQDKIGGVTWNADGVLYQCPPKQTARVNQQDNATRTAKRVVLDRILRHQEFAEPLNETIDTCLNDPEHLYRVLK